MYSVASNGFTGNNAISDNNSMKREHRNVEQIMLPNSAKYMSLNSTLFYHSSSSLINEEAFRRCGTETNPFWNISIVDRTNGRSDDTPMTPQEFTTGIRILVPEGLHLEIEGNELLSEYGYFMPSTKIVTSADTDRDITVHLIKFSNCEDMSFSAPVMGLRMKVCTSILIPSLTAHPQKQESQPLPSQLNTADLMRLLQNVQSGNSQQQYQPSVRQQTPRGGNKHNSYFN